MVAVPALPGVTVIVEPLIDTEAKVIEENIKLTRAALDEIEGCIDYITELTDVVKGE